MEAIKAFLESEKAPEGYSTQEPSLLHGEMHTYHHFFRREGPLMWFNPEVVIHRMVIKPMWDSESWTDLRGL